MMDCIKRTLAIFLKKIIIILIKKQTKILMAFKKLITQIYFE